MCKSFSEMDYKQVKIEVKFPTPKANEKRFGDWEIDLILGKG